MTETTLLSPYRIIEGDCLDVLREMEPESIDSVVTDPPYGLSEHSPSDVAECLSRWIAGERYAPKKKGFMGREWDSWVPGPEVWREVFRVLKPGGHMLVFAGTRSMDLACLAVRLAGFELRDSIFHASDMSVGAPLKGWAYSQGFPKSLDVGRVFAGRGDEKNAEKWKGWHSGLKPALEPILIARKPMPGSIVDTVATHGCGALNIDACRVEVDGSRPWRSPDPKETCAVVYAGRADGSLPGGGKADGETIKGRFPSNFCHDGSDTIVSLFPESAGQNGALTGREEPRVGVCYGKYGRRKPTPVRGDAGSASRFFKSFEADEEPFLYCPKATKKDRSEGCGEQGNPHPTVKPTSLCRWLCRLVTQPGGVVLDPFAGSGSVGKGALLEGFRFVGIEREHEYCELARARLEHALAQASDSGANTRKLGKTGS